MSAFKPEHMSGGGALQQRTTYLISLTLVKIEAMEENGGEAKRVEDQPGEETRVALEVPKPQRFADPDGERRSPGKDHPPATAPVLARGAGPDRPPSNLAAPERLQKTKSADLTGCTSPSASPGRGPPEPSQTPTRTSLQIRPLGQRPVSLLKSHSSVSTRGRDSREGRDRSPPSAQSLDRKDCRAPTRSPGPCRASWAEASRPDGWRELQDDGPPGPQQEPGGLGMRDIPKKERLKTGSASLPVPSQPVKPAARKGKSRTLDNSDLNSLSEEMGLAREAQQAQRGAAKDRKMLKFISGIFTKTSGPSVTVAPPGVQRDSSEEEGREGGSPPRQSEGGDELRDFTPAFVAVVATCLWLRPAWGRNVQSDD